MAGGAGREVGRHPLHLRRMECDASMTRGGSEANDESQEMSLAAGSDFSNLILVFFARTEKHLVSCYQLCRWFCKST